MKNPFEPISDMIYGIRELGFSFRFALANLLMGDELRQEIVTARLNIDNAIRYMDIHPEFCKRKLKQSYDGLEEVMTR